MIDLKFISFTDEQTKIHSLAKYKFSFEIIEDLKIKSLIDYNDISVFVDTDKKISVKHFSLIWIDSHNNHSEIIKRFFYNDF